MADSPATARTGTSLKSKWEGLRSFGLRVVIRLVRLRVTTGGEGRTQTFMRGRENLKYFYFLLPLYPLLYRKRKKRKSIPFVFIK